MIKKYIGNLKNNTLNEYLLSTLGRNLSSRGTYIHLDVKVSHEDILVYYFGEHNERRMCTGLNERMLGILKNKPPIIIKRVNYRPDKGGIYTCTCSLGWSWDSRAFTPPIDSIQNSLQNF